MLYLGSYFQLHPLTRLMLLQLVGRADLCWANIWVDVYQLLHQDPQAKSILLQLLEQNASSIIKTHSFLEFL